jgi:exodeoxyribonuclease V beta subunit
MRLETDADLVQVITMHKAKGLQFPWVYLPFAANFKKEKKDTLRSDAERLAEDKRLLYVALTRAEKALFVGVANRSQDFTAKSPKPASALSDLLGRTGADDLQAKLQAWSACPAIRIEPAPEPSDALYRPVAASVLPQTALTPQRQHRNPWWMASFSALTRHADATPWRLPSENDERWHDAQTDSQAPVGGDGMPLAVNAPPVPFNDFKAGSVYGTLLHDLLEWQLKEGWPIARDTGADFDTATAAETDQRWRQVFSSQTAALQLDDTQCALLLQWLQQLALTPLPLAQAGLAPPTTTPPSTAWPAPLVLSHLTTDSAWAEMNFTLRTHGVQAQALDVIIQTHVLPGQPREPLQARKLQGLLTGFMDLVFEHAGRYYVLDYKSNKLAAYAPADLAQGLLAHRYDVQFSLYLLALHRLLQARLPGYDYETHMGGAVYLFARGIDQAGAGVFAHRPVLAMIEALDAALKERA